MKRFSNSSSATRFVSSPTALGLFSVLLGICFSASGCYTTREYYASVSKSVKENFDVTKKIPWGTAKERKEKTPQRVVAFWNDAVLNQQGQKPQRGFGGRLYFYEDNEKEPIKTSGQLVIYAFDEANRSPVDNKPTRRYVFPPEQLAKLYSDSEIGPSYSVWLPWDEIGGEQKMVSLIARLEPTEGPMVVSREALQQLPGSMPILSKPRNSGPQLAAFMPRAKAKASTAIYENGVGQNKNGQNRKISYEAGSQNEPQSAISNTTVQRMTTTTIELPNRPGYRPPVISKPSNIRRSKGSRSSLAASQKASMESKAANNVAAE